MITEKGVRFKEGGFDYGNIDDELSLESTNPVQNKVISRAIDFTIREELEYQFDDATYFMKLFNKGIKKGFYYKDELFYFDKQDGDNYYFLSNVLNEQDGLLANTKQLIRNKVIIQMSPFQPGTVGGFTEEKDFVTIEYNSSAMVTQSHYDSVNHLPNVLYHIYDPADEMKVKKLCLNNVEYPLGGSGGGGGEAHEFITEEDYDEMEPEQNKIYFLTQTSGQSAVGRINDLEDRVDALEEDKLPSPRINDRYLHTNAETGALEWSMGGGGGDVTKAYVDQQDAGLTARIDQEIIDRTDADTALETAMDEQIQLMNELLDNKVDRIAAQSGNPFVYGRMNSEAGGTEGKFTMSQSAIATSVVQRNNKKQIMIRTDSSTEAWNANEAAPYSEAEKVKQSTTTTNADLSLVLMPHNRVEDGHNRVYYNTNIKANPSTGTITATAYKGDGSQLTGVAKPSDLTTKADITYVDTADATKQDKLTAGENITIENNVISAQSTPGWVGTQTEYDAITTKEEGKLYFIY